MKEQVSDEPIVGFLRPAGAGLPIRELCRQNGFSDATIYKWRARFGGMQAGEATRLRETEAENTSSRSCWPRRICTSKH